MAFTFGCARALYDEGVHPRLLVGPEEVRALWERSQTGDGKLLLDGLRAWIAPFVARALEYDDLVAVLLSDARHPSGVERTLLAGATMAKAIIPLDSMAMLGVLEENADAIEAVRRVLVTLPVAEQQGETGYKRIGNSFTWTIPLAYDLVAAYLTENERRAYAAWAVDSCIRQVLEANRPRYLKSAGRNIPAVEVCCNALPTLLALQGEPGVPDLSAELKELLRCLDATLHCVTGPEGYPEEDMGYGTCMQGALSYIVEAVRRAGLYDAYTASPRYNNFGQAILHVLQPWGVRLSNTGDNFSQFPDRSFLLPRLATETNDPTLLWLLTTFSSVDDQPDDKRNIVPNIRLSNGVICPARAIRVGCAR